jgi:hypothetical protein
MSPLNKNIIYWILGENGAGLKVLDISDEASYTTGITLINWLQ